MKRPYGIIVFAAALSALFLGLAVVFGSRLVKQAATSGWTATPARVLTSSVSSSRGSKGKRNYKALISYSYTVGSVAHTSDAVDLGPGFSNGSRLDAQTLVRQHPVGATVTAYVNPADATEAVLVRGLSKRHWQTASFLSLFAVVPVIPWMFAVGAWRVRGPGHVGTVRVFEPAPGVWVVRNPGIGPATSAAIGFFGCVVPSTLVGVLVLSDRPREAMLGGWALSVLVALVAFVWRSRWVAAGRADTVIDTNQGVLIPARKGRSSAEAIPLAEVTGTRLRQDSGTATNKQNHHRVHVAVGGRAKTVPIGDIRHRADAEVFQSWLRLRLGLPERDEGAPEQIAPEPPTQEH